MFVRLALSFVLTALVLGPADASALDAYQGPAGAQAQVTVMTQPSGRAIKVSVALRVPCDGRRASGSADLRIGTPESRRAFDAAGTGELSRLSADRSSYSVAVSGKLRGDRRSGLRWEGTLRGVVTPAGSGGCELPSRRWRARVSTGRLDASRDGASTSAARAWAITAPVGWVTGRGDELEVRLQYGGSAGGGAVRISPPGGLLAGRFVAEGDAAYELIGLQLDRACLTQQATVDVTRARFDRQGWLRSFSASFLVTCRPWTFRGRVVFRRGG